MLTLQQFLYLTAVADHGSFLAASKACHVTQPTLSMQVQKLEAYLGVVLFDRSKQPIVPTELGRLVVDQARVALRESDRIHELIRSEQSSLGGELIVGVIPTIAPDLLPMFVGQFLKEYPQVNLKIDELTTDDIILGLERDSLDVGILATPLNRKSLTERPLYNEPFQLYLPIDHPITRLATVRETDLSVNDLILLTEGHCLRGQMLAVCGAKGIATHQRFHFQSGSLETILRFVEIGQGYTIVPYLTARGLRACKSTRVRNFGQPVPYREISLVTHRKLVKQKLVEALHQSIQNHLPDDLHEVSSSSKLKRIGIDSGSRS